ncbi:hypothetical protein TVAG_458100 [Trichomonas vaginalis G3]|uniref:Glycosyltransferase 61 catalytic domain-containing protein n=1 Tax=Trichomonas vaginalis (strain ATCC PRA-98 / G3) TaxID=412133 RepID=A2FKU1_TRIV3|nr:glycosyltransferase family [Trichomonas vaginalis G3]EAX94479.1 hypothetical protein TVAG_458100 [Trichomonas vaginalis G3]KAI5504310.1 glycosyltransferase family [Trichomonas vaginalis G3]|eukprot:XP_001307409.1 hypothetical protein [Trichomonas vaginalis G3]
MEKITSNQEIHYIQEKWGDCLEYVDEITIYNISFPDPTGHLFGFTENLEFSEYRLYENTFLIPKYPKPEYMQYMTQFKSKFAYYRNAYASHNGEFVVNNYRIRPLWDTAPPFARSGAGGRVVLECDKACVFGHGNTKNFGHFVIDYLSPLMLVPEEFFNDCVVVVSKDTNRFAEDFLRAIGVQKYISLEYDECVFAKRLCVSIEPRPHYGHFGPPIQMLHQRLSKFYNLYAVKPSKFVLLNRQGVRRISNIADIHSALKEKYPEYNWEIIKDNISPIEFYAKIFSSLRFCLTAQGSNMIKSIFMRPETTMVILGDSYVELSWMTFLSIPIYAVIYLHKAPHFSGEIHTEIPRCVKAVDAAVAMIKNGKWPAVEPNVTFIDYLDNFTVPKN